jgi:hypothetical protein
LRAVSSSLLFPLPALFSLRVTYHRAQIGVWSHTFTAAPDGYHDVGFAVEASVFDVIGKPHFGVGQPVENIALYDVAAAISGPAHEPRLSASYCSNIERKLT